MSKKQTPRTHKFLRADASRLSPETIEEIRNAQNNIPNAQRIMCKKYRIGSTTYQKIIDNQRPSEPTEEWRRIIESVSVSDQISENNQEYLHNTSSSTNIQEDGITHTEYCNENDANSNADKVANSFKDDTSRREFDLNKLVNITREAVMHPIYSP
ncbi:hypothetical protein C1645_830683 [Glomus cerebriforme]|uniref:Uncharacterized protein n=1 Tax=Glomus cerebriforme TaxID=658196 RepID=A0A397SS80_9GLOM|nr:hypothetical protein C1645_830683 [Glomus cerebriforme]